MEQGETFKLFVKGEEDEIIELEVKEKTLSKIDKGEMIDALYEITDSFEHLQKEGLDSERVGYWAKFMFLLDEPVSIFLSTAFDLKDVNIPVLLNINTLKEIVSKNEWLGIKAKEITSKMVAIAKKDD
ncbi:hypothetical protein [Lactococcus lactis]|uniref:hypothetical protein n=1 Tax=Lactococcus lactis TaxID=1358 RepID=UPI002416AD4B|nr:hypothetical protein [Lactococcus lactis]MDG4968248.1 hypothetical protein [Lactococcus lactis]MDG5102196.1 hypothetical protein [Lactococcus lactis]